MSQEESSSRPMIEEASTDEHGSMALKAVVAILAAVFIAAPVAYGAYEIYGLSTPGIDVWRWPAIVILAAAFVVLAWWVVVSIRRNFPYS